MKIKNILFFIFIISSCDMSSDLSIGGNISGDVQFNSESSSTGIGGSMARFTIKGEYLYTVDSDNLKTFDIKERKNPEIKSEVSLGWGVETIFPYGENLFIGAQSGMHIYSLENKEEPLWLSTYEHLTSCDPVVVQDDFAFVTLRGGTECFGFNNQLDIVDVSNLKDPKLFKTYDMINPHGLGIDGNCLFISEGDYGLKMFDITNLEDIKLTKHFEDLSSLDVIPYQGILMVIGGDGFHQYGYDCENTEISYISTIPIERL